MMAEEFEPVVGLEIHAELLTASKMFCGCAVVDSIASAPNTAVCEICTGMPGSLPVINERAVEYALRVALALHCTIHPLSVFARKNYFYPDLPKGYQISQYENPLATNGWLEIESNGLPKRVRIRRAHLEEDTGKLFHRGDYSLIDYNRSGVPLLEVVSEPDLRSVEEVSSYVTAIRSMLRYLRVNSGDMHKGVIRFEANVSIRPAGSDLLATRTEIKNLNSFRALTRGVSYEIERQIGLAREGVDLVQETLGWDEQLERTVPQRGKEEAHDYRYFPEPDLPPMELDPAWIESIRRSLPELPQAKRTRFMSEFGLSAYNASVLTTEPDVAAFFETAAKASSVSPASIANWITGELFGLLNRTSSEIQHAKLSPVDLAKLVEMVEAGTINASSAKLVLETMFSRGGSPLEIVEANGLRQLDDLSEIDLLVFDALDQNPEQVRQYRMGKETIFNWFFGQVMKSAGGRANPQTVRSRLEKALQEQEQPPP